MIPTPNRASSAMAARTTTRALDPNEAKRIARIIQRLLTATNREAAFFWGSDYRGLLSHLFGADCRSALTDAVQLVIDDDARVVGFRLEADAVDYRDLVVSLDTAGSPIIGQPPNQNISRACGTPSIEERATRHLHRTELPAPIIEALADLGIELVRLPLSAANKIARAMIAEALRNTIGPEHAGALHQLRAFGATVRQALILPLFESDGQAELRRDLLQQAPILALAHSTLYAFAGRSPKDALRSIGLPVEARRILPKALSPIARWMHLEERELTAAELGWLKPTLCNALPATTPGQHAVMSLARELLMGHLADEAVAERCIWASRHAGELFAKDTSSVRDWLLADPALLTRAGIQPWHTNISATAARQAATTTTEIHTILKDVERASAFPRPNWATRQHLPNSKWVFAPIVDEISLIAAGARMRNCAGIYGPAARTGRTIIAEIRRPIPAKPNGKVTLPRDGDEEIGALVEISHRWDRWQLVQAKGFANADPRTSAVDAVVRLLAQINGEG